MASCRLQHQAINSGLSLSDYDHEDLELRYQLLPRSFRECADVLGRIIAVNRELPPQPRDRRAVLTGGIEFFQYLYNQRRDVWDALQEAQDSYNREQFPELGDGPYMFIPADRRNYRRVSDRWLEAVRQIDEEWLRRADRINSARNRAAHSHDEARIARQLGFNGPNVLQQVKQSCLELIEQLLGIVPFDGD